MTTTDPTLDADDPDFEYGRVTVSADDAVLLVRLRTHAPLVTRVLHEEITNRANGVRLGLSMAGENGEVDDEDILRAMGETLTHAADLAAIVEALS